MSQKIRPIGPDAVHVCIDMQRLFAEPTAWYTASISTILPVIVRLAGHCLSLLITLYAAETLAFLAGSG